MTRDLNSIDQVLKVVVLVNSSPTFIEQHVVANGASELLKAVFGKAGSHARTAFGVAQLPFGACVEIEMMAEVLDRRAANRRNPDMPILVA